MHACHKALNSELSNEMYLLSVIVDGTLQFKHAPAVKQTRVCIEMCRDSASRTTKSRETGRDDSKSIIDMYRCLN